MKLGQKFTPPTRRPTKPPIPPVISPRDRNRILTEALRSKRNAIGVLKSIYFDPTLSDSSRTLLRTAISNTESAIANEEALL